MTPRNVIQNILNRKRNSIFAALAFLTMLCFGCGCAKCTLVPVGKMDEKDLLKDNVTQLMDAKVAGKWDVVYDFCDPAFRQKMSKSDYLRGKKLQFKGYTIRNLEILPSGNEANVEISNQISMEGYDFNNAPEVQHWVKTDGKWYLKAKEKANPFAK